MHPVSWRPRIWPVDVRGPQGLQGEQGASQLRAARYTYSINTAVPPGTGEVRFNNATFASVTAIHIHETNLDAADIALALQSILEGQQVYVQKRDDHASFVAFTVTGAFTDAGNYITFPVQYDSAGTDTGGPALAAGEVTVFIVDPQGGGGAATLDPIPESTVLGREAGDGSGEPVPIQFNLPVQQIAAATSMPAVRAAVGVDRFFTPLFTEFLAHNTLPNTNMGLPWYGIPVATGTATNLAPSESDHPGIVVISSAAAVTTGWGYVTQVANVFVKGGEKTSIVFRIPALIADLVMRFGFQDSHTSGATSNAAFIRVGGLTLDGFSRKDGNITQTTTPTANYTLTANVWYSARSRC